MNHQMPKVAGSSDY